MFSAPAVIIILALFIDYILSEYKSKKWSIVLVVLLFALPIRYNIERGKYFSNKERTKDWVEEIKEFQKVNLDNEEIVPQ